MHFMLLVLVAVVGSGLAVSAGSWTPTEDGAGPAIPSVPTLTISLPSKSFSAGLPISFQTIVHNPTPAEITVWSSGYWPNHLVILVDQDGAEPPLTAEGKERKLRFFNPARDKNFPRILTSHQSHDEGEHCLTDAYHLKPGDYALKILYSDGQAQSSLTLLSNRVRFRVTAVEPHL